MLQPELSPNVKTFCDLLNHGLIEAGYESLLSMAHHDNHGPVVMFYSYTPRTPKAKRSVWDIYFISPKGVHALDSTTGDESTTTMYFDDTNVSLIAVTVLASMLARKPLNWPECQTCLAERQENQLPAHCLN